MSAYSFLSFLMVSYANCAEVCYLPLHIYLLSTLWLKSKRIYVHLFQAQSYTFNMVTGVPGGKASTVLGDWIQTFLLQHPDLYDCVKDRLTACHPWSLETSSQIVTVFRHLLRVATEGVTICIVDDLDNCDRESIDTLIKFLSQDLPFAKCEERCAVIKVLVTSAASTRNKTFAKIDLDYSILLSSRRARSNGPCPRNFRDMMDYGDVSKGARSSCVRLLGVLAILRTRPTISHLPTILETTEEELRHKLEECKSLVFEHNSRLHLVYHQQLNSGHKRDKLHQRVAQSCLNILKDRLNDTKLEELQCAELVEIRAMDSDLLYAMPYWGEHVRHAKSDHSNMLDDILQTLAPGLDFTQRPLDYLSRSSISIAGASAKSTTTNADANRSRYYDLPIHK